VGADRKDFKQCGCIVHGKRTCGGYHLYVQGRAYKTAAGKTIYSEYTRLAAKTRIAKVATFTGSAVSASAVKLDWSKNDKATGYVIEQYKGGKWTVLATTKNNTTLTFTVKGLARNTTYSFRIKAFRKTGSTTEFSEYSSLKAATRK